MTEFTLVGSMCGEGESVLKYIANVDNGLMAKEINITPEARTTVYYWESLEKKVPLWPTFEECRNNPLPEKKK